jgi:hypothetical protein
VLTTPLNPSLEWLLRAAENEHAATISVSGLREHIHYARHERRQRTRAAAQKLKALAIGLPALETLITKTLRSERPFFNSSVEDVQANRHSDAVRTAIVDAEEILAPLGIDAASLYTLLGLPLCDSDREKLQIRLRSLDDEHAVSSPERYEALTTLMERDEEVVSLIKKLRGPQCQICGATFQTKTGSFYAEVDHLATLSKGGLDISQNMLVLCAHHHRQFHFGDEQILKHTEQELEVSLDGTRYVCHVDNRQTESACDRQKTGNQSNEAQAAKERENGDG